MRIAAGIAARLGLGQRERAAHELAADAAAAPSASRARAVPCFAISSATMLVTDTATATDASPRASSCIASEYATTPASAPPSSSGTRDAEQAELAELAQLRDRETRPTRRARRAFGSEHALGEVARGALDEQLLFGRREVCITSAL